MVSVEVVEDISVSLSEGGVMDLIKFEEVEGAGDIGELCPYEGGEEMDMDGGNLVYLNKVKIDPPKVGMNFETWEEADVYYNAFGKQERFGVVLGQSAYKTLKDGRKVKCVVTWKCECAGWPDTRRRIRGKRVAKELAREAVAIKKLKKCGCEAGMYAGLKEHEMTISHETEKHDEEGQWKNLTNDILALILKRLNMKADLCRFRSICKSWRFFATPIQPHLMFPLILPPLHPNARPFSLSPALIYIISPQFTHHNHNNSVWLTKVSETGENKWALLNPLTKHKLYYYSSGVFRGRINLLGFRNLEVGRSYRLQLISDHGDEDTFDFEEFSSSISLRKVVVRIGEEISVLGLYGYGQIAVWNSGDENWKIIETGKKEKKNEFDDVICFDEKFYAVDRTGRLVMINPAARELVEVVGTSTVECNGFMP